MNYIITPLMNNNLVRRVLTEKLIDERCRIVFVNEVPKHLNSMTEFLTVSKIYISHFKELWYAAYQRAARKTASPKPRFLLILALVIKNFYITHHILYFSRRHNVFYLPTSEPYIESLTLRLVARELRVACVNYTAREYLGFVIEPFKLLPTVIDFENIISELNYKTSGDQTQNFFYSTGGPFVSSLRHEGCDLKKRDLSSSVIIFLHDLLDAPGIFGRGIFSNLMEWLEVTLRVLESNNTNYLLKPHPNQVRASKLIMEDFIRKNSLNNKLLNVSNLEIFKGAPKLIITNHGSVSLEALAYGIPSIVAGRSLTTVTGMIKPFYHRKEYIEHLQNLKPNPVLMEVPSNILDTVSKSEVKYRINKPVLFDYSYLDKESGIKTNEDLLKFCTVSEDFKVKQDKAFDQSDKKAFLDILCNASSRVRKKRVAIILTEDFTYEFYIKNIVLDTDCNFVVFGRFADEFLIRNNSKYPNVIFEDISINRKSIGLKNIAHILKIALKLKFYNFDQVITMMPKANLLGQISSALTFQKNRYMISTGNLWLARTGLSKYVFFAIERLCVLLTDVVVCDSKSQYDLMVSSHARYRKKFRYVNGLSVRNFLAAKSTARGTGALVVGHVGRLCERKGTEFVEQIAEILFERGVDVTFKFAGLVEDEITRERLMSLLARHPDKIALDEGLFDFEAVVNGIDILLMPSLFEGFGIAAVEASKLNTVVIGFDVVGLQDSIANDRLGHLVSFGDVEAIVDLISDYAVNRSKLISKTQLSKINANRDFDAADVTSRLRIALDL